VLLERRRRLRRSRSLLLSGSSTAGCKLAELGCRVREWTRAAESLFIINDRPDLAVLTDADGVHVGQDELTVHQARRIIGPDRLVGVSTHSIEQARTAVLDGADYLGVGPVFPSQTKQFDDFVGLDLFARWPRRYHSPGSRSVVLTSETFRR